MTLKKLALAIVFVLFVFLVTGAVQSAEIHYAAAKGELAKVKELIKKDPKLVNLKDDLGRTPLHTAAWSGQAEVVKFLLSKGADLQAKDSGDDTPLHLGCHPAANMYNEKKPSQESALAVVKLLLAKGAKINQARKDGRTPLHWAAQSGYVELVRLLLAKGAKVNAPETTGRIPLFDASVNGNPEVIKLLISKGAKINTPLKKDDFFGGYTPLHIAAFNGNLEAVEVLVASGAKLETKDRYGMTPLMLAVKGKTSGRNDEVVAFLLKKGANIEASDLDKNTPLLFATAPQPYEDTPMAYQKQEKTIIKTLLDKDANIKVKDKDGQTPLHFAAIVGDKEVVN